MVFAVAPQETVAAAAGWLEARRVGAMVVIDGDAVVGILSERDVVRVIARGGPAALDEPVSGCMTPDVLFARPSETVDILLERMTDRRIRHLPVVEGGRLVGIISIGDLVKRKIDETQAEADGLKAYIAAG